MHEIARANGITFYAPVRKTNRRSLKKKPRGKYRRECVELPEFYGMRWMNETVNSVLKRTQINALRSKKAFMKKREFGWQVIFYNIKRIIKISDSKNNQAFFIFQIEIYSIRTEEFLMSLKRHNIPKDLYTYILSPEHDSKTRTRKKD